MKTGRAVLLATVAVLVLLPGVALAGGNGNPNPRVLPPNSTPYGKSLGEWGGAWWNWALQFPAAQCPLLDPDGSQALNGQSGPVYFLAGTFGWDVERTVTIPTGKALLIPLYNWLFWVPEDGPDEATIRAMANAGVDDAAVLECKVDGVPLINPWAYRAESPPGGFVLHVPPGSVLTDFGYDPGDRYPAVTDGYWLMLTPLPPGEHVIWWHAVAGDPPYFELAVTYNLTVLPGGK